MLGFWYKQESTVSYFPAFSSTTILLAKGILPHCLQDQIAPSTELLFSIREKYLTYNSTNNVYNSAKWETSSYTDANTLHKTCLAQSWHSELCAVPSTISGIFMKISKSVIFWAVF